MASIVNRKNLLSDVLASVSLYRSGVFDTGLYRQANADVPADSIAAIFHFCRHGRREQREWNQTALGQWLTPYVLDGSLSAGQVRNLVDKVRRGDDAESAVRGFCDRHQLNIDEYLYHADLDAQNYAAAYERLSRLPMQIAFLPFYYFARRHMKLDRLDEAFEWIKAELAGGAPLGIQELLAARDIADALGYPDRDRTGFNRLLLEGLSRWPAPNPQARHRAMWQIGFPLIRDGSALYDRIRELLPPDLCRQLAPAGITLPSSVKGWETILNLVTFNALQEDWHVIPLQGAESDMARLADHADDTCRLRVLGEGYWRLADHDAIQASFVGAFKAAAQQVARQYDYFCPVAASNIFDVRKSGENVQPTLSYHTVSRRRQRFLNFKESALPGYFKFDREGFSGWEGDAPTGADAVPADVVDAAFRDLQETYVHQRRSKYTQQESDEALPESFVLVALQIPDDTVMSLASMDLDTWLAALVAEAESRGLQLVIKAHPIDRSHATRRRLERLATSDSVFISRTSIHVLLEKATAIVTVNSGVGIEALLRLKPVMSLGACEYEEVSWPVRSVSELAAALDASAGGAADPDWVCRVKAYLYRYCHEQSFTLDSFPAAFDAMAAEVGSED